ncbi:MAG: D-alanyl-D-alanine carboxypeptidase family protein [Actinomycetota bacterium]|nr:D-alanyl-D-alanine carboxypeptidase family protein [Actinomycetota bacterium]
MISTATAALVFALLAPLGSFTTMPTEPVAPPAPPKVSAYEWAVYDETAGVMLATWNVNERRPMASVTKVMTAMIVLDETELDDIVTVPAMATTSPGSSAGLVTGERWTVYDLLVAMLVRSGNDAALTLAWHVGDGSIDAFVVKMNARAVELEMSDTHFANPNGLDHADHFSTANDLVTMTVASLDYSEIQQIARIKTIKMPADPTGKARQVNNTNRLLGTYPGVVGLKTGDTPFANKVLLGVAERGLRRIVTVVMGSDDHFSDTRELLDWAYSTYGLRDRWLRPFFSEQGGGGTVSVDLDLTNSEQRRLGAMQKIDDGRWRMSAFADLPKAALITEWLKAALPGVVGGDR